MSSVYEENVECPVCHQRSAGLDLNCKTNEQELICHRPECGYAYEQQIVQRKSSSGKEYSFWQVTEEFPMNEDGSVRRRTNAVTEELKDVEILDPPDALERVKAAAAALYPSIADLAPAAIAPIKKSKPQTHLISADLTKTYCGLDVKTAAFGKIGKATCKECKRLSMESTKAKWIADTKRAKGK